MPVIARFNRNFSGRGAPVDLARRRFVQGISLTGLALGLPLPSPAGAGGGQRVLEGTEFDLTIGETPVNFTGRAPR